MHDLLRRMLGRTGLVDRDVDQEEIAEELEDVAGGYDALDDEDE